MCGRFSLTIAEMRIFTERFQALPSPRELKPHYNFAPTQETLAVVNWQDRRQLIPMSWGLLPFWSQKGKGAFPLINVRCESLKEKPVFKHYLAKQRCLIPADGFFEWREENNHKVPYRIIVNNDPLFAFAGFWEKVAHPDGKVDYGFAILTCEANALVYAIHDRMPVILSSARENDWLDENLTTIQELEEILLPFPAEQMRLYKVSADVNSVKNDSPHCIQPIE